MNGTTPAVVLDGVDVRYGPAKALREVSLDVAAGSVVAVLGANGAGKSSLARAVSGLVPPSAGRILINGIDVTHAPAYRIRRQGLLHLSEGRGIFASLTVAENLRLATLTLPRRERQPALDAVYATFPVLGERRRQLAGRLSGGEQQMLSMSRAVATTPAVVVADELSLGLAPKMVDLVFATLAAMRARGAAIILIEQFVHRALALADECLMLQRGTVVWRGPAEDAADHALRGYLGADG
ncbi:MAG TPA: ABC transporter ATP-binding protein [Pseudonocardiaceae bacterium]|jgi:branched-chain amino acid transport system ATP-binding protein|nr:ABC transporter ATP-binding protein [Pseudonocardiaceae bacterium]